MTQDRDKRIKRILRNVLRRGLTRNLGKKTLSIDQALSAIKKEYEQDDIMGGETPELPYKPTQKEMQQLAIRDIRARKKGKYKLVYNREKRTIVAEKARST